MTSRRGSQPSRPRRERTWGIAASVASSVPLGGLAFFDLRSNVPAEVLRDSTLVRLRGEVYIHQPAGVAPQFCIWYAGIIGSTISSFPGDSRCTAAPWVEISAHPPSVTLLSRAPPRGSPGVKGFGVRTGGKASAGSQPAPELLHWRHHS